MTTTHDITGVSKCASKKTSIDITDKQLFAILETQISKQAADFLRQHRGGETLHIPACEDKREAARRWDDGSRSVGEVARLAGCSERTVERVRAERRGA